MTKQINCGSLSFFRQGGLTKRGRKKVPPSSREKETCACLLQHWNHNISMRIAPRPNKMMERKHGSFVSSLDLILFTTCFFFIRRTSKFRKDVVVVFGSTNLQLSSTISSSCPLFLEASQDVSSSSTVFPSSFLYLVWRKETGNRLQARLVMRTCTATPSNFSNCVWQIPGLRPEK